MDPIRPDDILRDLPIGSARESVIERLGEPDHVTEYDDCSFCDYHSRGMQLRMSTEGELEMVFLKLCEEDPFKPYTGLVDSVLDTDPDSFVELMGPYLKRFAADDEDDVDWVRFEYNGWDFRFVDSKLIGATLRKKKQNTPVQRGPARPRSQPTALTMVQKLEQHIDETDGASLVVHGPGDARALEQAAGRAGVELPPSYVEVIQAIGGTFHVEDSGQEDLVMVELRWLGVEEPEEVVDDDDEDLSEDILCFQRISNDAVDDFYAFYKVEQREDGEMPVVAVYHDSPGLQHIADSFDEHMEMLVNRFIDGD